MVDSSMTVISSHTTNIYEMSGMKRNCSPCACPCHTRTHTGRWVDIWRTTLVLCCSAVRLSALKLAAGKRTVKWSSRRTPPPHIGHPDQTGQQPVNQSAHWRERDTYSMTQCPLWCSGAVQAVRVDRTICTNASVDPPRPQRHRSSWTPLDGRTDGRYKHLYSRW